MGSSQEYSPTNSNRKDDFFDQAEQAAFQHVNANLRDMPYCDRGDLEQAAKSYFFQSVNASGAGHLFREAYVEGKAATWAAWWFRKHRDRRTPRPHSLYSIDQARRGGKTSAIRKKGEANWRALRAQIQRAKGDQLAQIAGELGCEIRTVSNLIKRLFPRIMGVILGHLFRWKHSKSSCLATPDIEVIDRKEPLLCFHVEGVQVGERPAERVQVDEIDRLGPQIGNILRELWAAQPL